MKSEQLTLGTFINAAICDAHKRDDNGDGHWDFDQSRTHNAANEIATISNSATQISHDRNGNMTKMPKPDDWSAAFTCVYDAWNRMVQIGSNIRYDYNAVNHRVKKTVGNTVTTSVFTSGWQELESTAGNETTAYVWGLRYIDDLVCRSKKVGATETERLYSLADPNWNVVALTDSNGNAQERYNYSAFGELNVFSGAFVARATSSYGWTRTFTGQVLDEETSLMLYRNRFYHAGLGRFVTRDPIGYEGKDVNIYRYVSNCSTMYFDELGTAIPLVGAVAGLAGLKAVLVAVAAFTACAVPQFALGVYWYPTAATENDKFLHCWCSCRIAKSCSGLVAQIIGFGKEAVDLAAQTIGAQAPQGFWASFDDLVANNTCITWETYTLVGGWIGTAFRQSCEDCCKCHFPF